MLLKCVIVSFICFTSNIIKVTVVYWCSKLIERKQTKTEGNTLSIREKQRNKWNTEVQQKQTPTYIERNI